MSKLNPLVFAATLLLIATPLARTAASQGSSQASASFTDQTIGGTWLVVDQATLPDGGFVAIHDSSLQDGAVLGSVVGASAFLPAGTHEDVKVRLSEPLTEDDTLIAMPHKDTDGDQIYSFVSSNGAVDGPYTSGGDIVVDDASITVSASVAAQDQPTDGQSVLVDSVEMAAGGFVAIHDSTLLQGAVLASVIGVSEYLAPGHHENVLVELDSQRMMEQTLIPMPHRDTDGDETYDFVTSGGQDDGPYTHGNGDPVLTEILVTPSETATVTYEAQTTGGNLVYTAEAFLPEGGFVVFHDSSLNDGEVVESVRGASEFLEPGLHRHIATVLDDPLNQDDTLIAMPHKDTDGDETYDFVTSGGQDDGPYTADGGAVTDDGETTYSASVHAHEQESDGRTLVFPTVDVSGGGFLAVHDTSLLAGEVVGSVIGVSEYLQPGLHRDVKVTLDEPLRTTTLVVPMPHRDTDGDETYDFVTSGGQDDGPFTGPDGPVIDTGLAVVRSTVSFHSQSSSMGAVEVASVTLHDGGFVVIHDSTLLDGKALTSVIGVSEHLSPGTHEDVRVELDDVPTGQVTLIAMPHLDTDGDGTYDFVTSQGSEDGPYTAGGSAVVHSAEISFPSNGAGDGGDGGADGGDGGADEPDSTPGPGVLAGLVAGLVAAAALGRRGKAR